jgi:large subunit ribosomal protein L9
MTTGTRENPVRAGRRVSVVLLTQLDALGAAGQEVAVAPGYARNKLVPERLAVYATAANRRAHARELAPEARALKDAERAENRVRARIARVVLSFRRATSDGRTLYGAITASDIVEGLQATELRNLRLLEANVRVQAAPPAGAAAATPAAPALPKEGSGEAAAASAAAAAAAPVAAAEEAAAAVAGKLPVAAAEPAAVAAAARAAGGNVLLSVGSYTVLVEPARVGYAGVWMPLRVEVASA